jgi:hypothetical protein
MKRRFSFILTASTSFVLLAAVFSGASAQGKATPNPCDLLTKAEAETLLKEAVSDGQTGKGVMPAVSTCKYSFKKKGATYGVTIKVATTDALRQEGFYNSAKDVFTRQKKARMLSEDTAKQMKAVPGLGDEAFWNGNDLWIIKGDYFVNIVAGSFLEGSFKSTEAMQKARYEKDLELSRKVAEKVVQKIR